MSEKATPEQSPPTANANAGNAEQPQENEQASSGATGNRHRGTHNRYTNRSGNAVMSTSKDFDGATPKIGGVLALRSENVTKKLNYDMFCEKLGTYIMNEFKNGDAVVEVTKDHDFDAIGGFETDNKPVELSADEKKSTVDVEIHKEEIKEYVKDLKTIKSNLKKMYSLIYGNCTESVQTMVKADTEYDEKSKIFDYVWLFKKVKTIVSGLDTKVNLRVSLHDAIANFILLKQQSYETNDAYLTRFKSMVETLKIAGGEHILVSKVMLKKELSAASKEEINAEKERFMAVCYMLKSDDGRYKRLNDDLKSSANRGRDEYPQTLTDAFNLLVRESGEYDTVRANVPRYRRAGGRGGRGRQSFLFAQTGRGGGGRGHDNSYSRTNENNSDEIVPGTNGETFQNTTCYGCFFVGIIVANVHMQLEQE